MTLQGDLVHTIANGIYFEESMNSSARFTLDSLRARFERGFLLEEGEKP